MSRQDIADYLGLTIETVSRTLTQLEKSATIELPTSRRIVLRNARAHPAECLRGRPDPACCKDEGCGSRRGGAAMFRSSRSSQVSSPGLPGGGENPPAGAAPSGARRLRSCRGRAHCAGHGRQRGGGASRPRRQMAGFSGSAFPADAADQARCAKIVRVEPQVVRDLERVCTLCASKRRCSRDFAKGRSASSWQAYCPNTMTLRALTADAGRSRL